MTPTQEFVHNIILVNTLTAGLAHNKVYTSTASSDEKERFRNWLATALSGYAQRYAELVKDEVHIANMRALQKEIAVAHGGLLRFTDPNLNCTTLSLGTVQKLLNLYLKFLWTHGRVLDVLITPPHCPFDRTIIQNLRKNDHKLRSTPLTKWTTPTADMNWDEYVVTDDNYQLLVDTARRVAGINDIATFELKKFNDLL